MTRKAWNRDVNAVLWGLARVHKAFARLKRRASHNARVHLTDAHGCLEGAIALVWRATEEDEREAKKRKGQAP